MRSVSDVNVECGFVTGRRAGKESKAGQERKTRERQLKDRKLKEMKGKERAGL